MVFYIFSNVNTFIVWKKIYSVIDFFSLLQRLSHFHSQKSQNTNLFKQTKNTDNICAARIRVGFSNLSYYINNQKFSSNSYQVSHYLDKALLMIYTLLQIINSTFLSLSKTHIIFLISLLNPLESLQQRDD